MFLIETNLKNTILDWPDKKELKQLNPHIPQPLHDT